MRLNPEVHSFTFYLALIGPTPTALAYPAPLIPGGTAVALTVVIVGRLLREKQSE